jgi:ribosomal protein S18 acetylase RimI-like enzyme
MNHAIQPFHDMSSAEVDAIEDHIYDHNRQATGYDDAQGLAFVIRDEQSRIIATCAGYTWAGSSELKQLWVDKVYRGRGYGRDLLHAFIEEAARRGVEQIWVASYDFQAPALYESAGFERMAEFVGWPSGHSNVLLRLRLPPNRVS